MPVATSDQFDQQMTRLVNHYYPGRQPGDFSDWATEVRRAFGDLDHDVLVRAVALWKMEEERLPIVAKFRDYLTEASKQLNHENQRALPPPTFKDAPRPADEVIEWHRCKGIAQARIWRNGGSSSPTRQEIQVVMEERHARKRRANDHLKEILRGRDEWDASAPGADRPSGEPPPI